MRTRSDSFILCWLVVLTSGFGCSSRSADNVYDGGPALPDSFVTEAGVVDNSTCKRATQIALSGGSVTVSGSTKGFTNEYGTQVSCGASYNTMLGPQAYYKVALSKGKVYKLSLSASFYGAKMYVAQAKCSPTSINTDCGSEGKTGAVTTSSSSSSTKSIFFTPPSSGSYLLVVDSSSSSKSNNGDFTLIVEEFTAPTNASCAKATRVTLSGGKASVSGTTEGGKNEFGTGINCGSTSTTMKGPQAYYKIAMTAGKSYIVSMTPQYSFAKFYIFSGKCDTASINLDCGSKGATGDYSSSTFKDKATQIVFTAAKSGDHTIAVDSSSEGYAGKFTLDVQEFAPPTNGACAKAKAVAVTGAKTTITGTTYGAKNEYGDKIKCDGFSANDGPQVYYKLNWTKGQTYKITASPSFTARVYVFGNKCDAASIAADCASKGKTGASMSAYSSGSYTNQLFFRPASSSNHLAIDSSSNSYFGTFTLTVEPFTAAANGTCAKAKSLTFTSGAVKVSGDTTGVPNEFGTAINCGNYKSIPYGSQVYYKVMLSAGKKYSISLTPDFSSAKLYIFGNSCAETSINAACSSKGKTGDVYAGFFSKGKTGTMAFTPQATGQYIIAVDATSDSSYAFGTFSLEIK